MSFIDHFCGNCSRNKAFRENPDGGEGCPIVVAALVYEIDDPNYPKEWIYDDERGPRCTAFTTDEPPPERCAQTMDMFGASR